MPILKQILWAFIVGVGIATIYTFYIRKVLGGLVRKLIAIDACSPEAAISLENINYKMNSLVKYSLRKGTEFSQTVLINEKGLYYINPEYLDKAKLKYKEEGTSVFLMFIILIVLAAVALISTYIYPQAIESLEDFIDRL